MVYFISAAVDALDLAAFHARYAGDGRRRQPFDPAMLVKVLVYAYASGVFSSRKIARRLEEDVGFRVLAAGNFPAHRTIREFRQLHLAEFSALFVQIVQLAREAGLVALGRVGIDGTKVKANASKRKAMSYGRMQSEGSASARRLERIIQCEEVAFSADIHASADTTSGHKVTESVRPIFLLDHHRERNELEVKRPVDSIRSAADFATKGALHEAVEMHGRTRSSGSGRRSRQTVFH